MVGVLALLFIWLAILKRGNGSRKYLIWFSAVLGTWFLAQFSFGIIPMASPNLPAEASSVITLVIHLITFGVMVWGIKIFACALMDGRDA